jgi:DNA-binding transcriptional LysR family regulator
MRDLDLTTLRLFVSVCETGNIARAAEQARIVGSAISKRLAQLESTVGVTLLVRRRRGVEPTPAGETMLEHAHAMLASVDRIERDMAAYAAGVKGQIRMLATPAVMAESLADDVALFLHDPAHRDIRVDIEERVSIEVIRGLREGSASVGICWDATDLSGLETRQYRTDHLAIVVHPSHPLAAHAMLGFEQALDFEHVSLPDGSAVQVMLRRAAALAGKPLVNRVIVSTFAAALRVVRANLAISVIPKEVAEDFGAVHGLRIIPLTDAFATRRFVICFRSEAALTRAAQLLVKHLADRALST